MAAGMVDQYKLRLGDGTVLAVDYDGLRTWLLDDSAMVQPPGSRRWRPLRQHLVEQPTAPVRRVPEPPVPVVPPAPPSPPPEITSASVGSVPVSPPPPPPAPPPPVPEPPNVEASPVPRILRVKKQPVPPAPVAAEAPAVAPAVPAPSQPVAPAIVPLALVQDEEPPFHVAAAPTAESLLDVAVAEVERHGGADPVWPWTPPDARKAASSPADEMEGAPSPLEPEAMEEIDLSAEEPPAREPVEPVVPIRLKPIALAPIPVAEWTPPETPARGVERYGSSFPDSPPEVSTGRPAPAPALPRRLQVALRLFARAMDALLARIPRSVAPRPGAPLPPSALTPPPARPDAVQPPPPLSALPVLRFAPSEDEPRVAREAAPGPAARAKPWAPRAFAGLGFAGLVVLAVATRSAWMPALSGLSRPAPVAVSPLPPPPPRVPEPPPLPPEVQRAIAQLPHLSAETVQLVMSKSERGLPDAPEVFRLAHAAAIRGEAELTAEEAQELRGLEKALLGSLSRADRERVRAYDRMSPERDLLVGEDAKVMALFTRGARALGAARRERLQALLGKAIAAEFNRPPTP